MTFAYQPYQHKVQYYETDQMGIVHHSNYIRWFEEARTDLLDQLGFGYEKLEASGIIIPVLEVSAVYRAMTYFGETVAIIPTITEYSGVRFTISYEVQDAVTKEVKTTGFSKHCFLTSEHRITSLKRHHTEMHQVFTELSEAAK